MSHLKQTDHLRSDEQALVRGYISETSHHDIPDTIQRLVMIFSFVLDEFQTVTTVGSMASITGFNHTKVTNSLTKTTETFHTHAIGRNTIIPHTGRYHWKCCISFSNSDVTKSGNTEMLENGIRIGFLDSKRERFVSFLIEPIETNNVMDLYFDSNTMTVHFQPESHLDTDLTLNKVKLNDKMSYHLGALFMGSGTVEITEHHQSNWYSINSIGFATNLCSDPMDLVGLAQCTYNHEMRVSLLSRALQSHPDMEQWNELYLISLNALERWNEAYEHAMTTKKGVLGIYRLAESFRERRDQLANGASVFLEEDGNGMNHPLSKQELSIRIINLYSLLNQQQIDDLDCNLSIGETLRALQRFKEAIPFIERHLEILEESKRNIEKASDTNGTDTNTDTQATAVSVLNRILQSHNQMMIDNLINRLAWTYYQAVNVKDNYKMALSTFQRLTEEKISQLHSEAAYAHCLQLGHDDAAHLSKALEFYEKYQQRYPQDAWSFARMAEIHGKRTNGESVEEQKQCLLKAVEFSGGGGTSSDNALSAQHRWYLAQFMEDVEGDTMRANELYHEALNIVPSSNKGLRSTIACSLSINYHVLEQWDEAIRFGLMALEDAPQSPTLIANVAEFYFHAKRYRNSYEMFQKSLGFEPFSALGNGYFALVLFEWDRIDEALIYLERFETLKAEVRGAANRGIKTKCALAMAKVYHRKGNVDMSIVKCQEALADEEDLIGYKEIDEIHYLMARNYCKQQEFDEALRHLLKAKQLNAESKKFDKMIDIIRNMREPAIDF